MALLKEDGSLDVERINQLPIDEYMKEIGGLTDKQCDEYLSQLPTNASAVIVESTKADSILEDELEKGHQLTEDIIRYLGKRKT